ncbi:hypothetical protein QA601_07805 [Chitinispirillales bacterium ANBcel5]|uniref:hypothetical protein n=1 Tax=Cellulosispirillum alkaliphilum TaxID=3039283 RepID=UPI002A56283C|nr:hypothetical protein [Chitinispirillales bacterium ANBcel5]
MARPYVVGMGRWCHDDSLDCVACSNNLLDHKSCSKKYTPYGFKRPAVVGLRAFQSTKGLVETHIAGYELP